MKPMNWYSRSVSLPRSTFTRTFQVKLKQLRLERFEETDEKNEEVIAIKIKWIRETKLAFLTFNRSSKKHSDFTTSVKMIKKGISIEWDEQFEDSCSFNHNYGDKKFRPWNLSFAILYGKKVKSTAKMVVIGKVSLNLAEEAFKMEAEIERKLPLKIHMNGVTREATLIVIINFLEMKTSQIALSKSRELKYSITMSPESAQGKALATQSRSRSLVISPEDQSQVSKKAGLFSWNKMRLSFKFGRTKEEPLIEKTKTKDDSNVSTSDKEFDIIEDGWHMKEIISRDLKTKLKTDMLFASFDQRSNKAAGESACSVLAVFISHWLQSNLSATPTRSEFDNLIIQGSSEWRKLCEIHVNDFPDKHFYLETILNADHIRPISISRDKSFVGFFCPEKFQCLKGMTSFDEIWDKISEDYEPKVYVISWNDHFFVLKVEGEAYYIVDTLGVRLFERCKQAYIVRFDESSVIYAKSEKLEASEEKVDDEFEEIICSGKECCKEFIKRFFAAIPLMEIEEEEKKKPVCYYTTAKRLQIEFNFCCSLASVSTTSSPLFSSDTSKSSPDLI